MGEPTNITGVILEHGVPDEAFKDFIGKDTMAWVKEYGTDVRVVVRENHGHERIELILQLTYIMLVPDGWNRKFDYHAVVRGGPEDRIGHHIEGGIEMTKPNGNPVGYVRAS
jgi:hypothetical protein